MRVMSLFAGIGGFDLAAHKMGWTTSVQVEIDEWCRKVLAKNFPDANRYSDIKQFDGTPYRGAIELLCGGFPCQPYSLAGKRKGKEDERHLWPEMLRVIREVRPRWVVGENVFGLLNWNRGMVFNEVCAELEAEGYEVQSFVLPACGVNAPHKRDRVWIVAYAGCNGYGSNDRSSKAGRQKGTSSGIQKERQRVWGEFGRIGPTWTIANPERLQSIERHKPNLFGRRSKEAQQIGLGCFETDTNPNGSGLQKRNATPIANKQGFSTGGDFEYWNNWPTQSPICTGNDGVSAGLDNARTIKGAGNAIVWPVVYQIFQAIQQTENTLNLN